MAKVSCAKDPGPWMQTRSGRAFHFFGNDPAEIAIADIIWHLSKIDRYNGAGAFTYSVAQHSVLVARYIWRDTLNARAAYEGLMHDAEEAYVGDISSPLKSLLRPVYHEIANGVRRRIAYKYSLMHNHDAPRIVKLTDIRITHNERGALFDGKPKLWHPQIENVSPLEDLIVEPMGAPEVRASFRTLFVWLRTQLNLPTID